MRSTEPLLSTHPTTEPRGGDGHIIKFFRRTSGTLFTFMHIAGVPLRFTTCLCSFVLSGLAKPYIDIKYVLLSSLQQLNGFTINFTGQQWFLSLFKHHDETVNGIWSVRLRGIHHHCSKELMQGYLDEYHFRYNRRNSMDTIFDVLIRSMVQNQPIRLKSNS